MGRSQKKTSRKQRSSSGKSPIQPGGSEGAPNDARAVRAGRIGFGLSLLAVVLHTVWVVLIYYYAETRQAQELTADDPESWIVVLLVLTGTLVTMAGLFLCLYSVVRSRSGRTLPLIGLGLSFFVGVFSTAFIVLSAFARP